MLFIVFVFFALSQTCVTQDDCDFESDPEGCLHCIDSICVDTCPARGGPENSLCNTTQDCGLGQICANNLCNTVAFNHFSPLVILLILFLIFITLAIAVTLLVGYLKSRRTKGIV